MINEIQYHPAGTGGEFIELANPGTTAVDISGWTIDAVGLTIQPGTVVPAGGRVVFVATDVAFRAAYTGANRLVGGSFSGTLDDAGEAVILKAGTRIVDSVSYTNAAPWPAAADGTGPSLELLSPTADNADPANWRAASGVQGTPGLPNTPDAAANIAPSAGLTASATGLTVAVNGSTSRDPDGTIASYAWKFSDNGTASGISASHTFAAAGTYTVTLTVTDNKGATGTASQTITVTATPGGAFAVDTFARTVTGGLGTAETGGAWAPQANASSFAVNGGEAKITAKSGTSMRVFLNAVSSTDTDLKTKISFTRQTASSMYAGVVARQVGAASYGARVVVSASGAVQLQTQLNTDTILKSANLSGVSYATGDKLNLRVQVFSTAPTTIRAKAWKVGAAEPASWLVSSTDATAALQAPGSIGLYSYLSSTASPSPIVVSYDDFWAGPTN
ncbi:PKD domain-containing protein [Microterricola viridarii]|uniref:PKD domain-containing protein n=1 Tax=Microterricola viridarii TaxID=412690 RepID=UPI000AC2594B|nr:PKD domain-containing protein [Microterricola viridarii]